VTAIAEQLGAETEFEHLLAYEMGAAHTQMKLCDELALIDGRRVIEHAETSWNIDRTAQADRLGAKLPKAPYTISHALEGTKHGIQYKLDHWGFLGEVVQAAGTLNEVQRDLCFDLLGVPHEVRANSPRVPAGTDTAGLKTLVAREVRRLETL